MSKVVTALFTLKQTYKPFRFGESLLISGFFVIGYFFAIDSLDSFKPLNFIYFFSATYLLVLSYYSMNSFVGYREDLSNNRLHVDGAKSRFLWFSAITGLFSFLLFWIHSPLLLILAAALFVIAYVYSAFFKYIPFAGTVMHLIAIPFKFNIGYIFVVGNIKMPPLLFSLYFGLLFAAGHIHHELIDFDSDGKNKMHTTAHFLGKQRAGHFYLLLVVFSFVYLFMLFLFEYISSATTCAFGGAFFVQLIAWYLFLANHKRKSADNLLINRRIYRIGYFVAGVISILLTYIK